MTSRVKFGLTGAIILLALLAYFAWSSRIPKDDQVQRWFAKDKAILIQLQEKLSQEPSKIEGVTPSEIMLDDWSNRVLPAAAGFSDPHFAEYHSLMSRAHIRVLWRSEGETDFAIAGSGFASYGWRLAFAYSKRDRSPLVLSIDHLPKLSQGNSTGMIYRPLGDDWYLKLIY